MGSKDSIVKRWDYLESKDYLSPHHKEEYCTLFQTNLIGQEIIDKIDRAKATLRDPESFYDLHLYSEALRTIQMGLKMVSIAYSPTELSLSKFEMKHPLKSEADLLGAAENQQENPFIMFYEDHFLQDLLKEPPDLACISITGTSQIVPGLTLARLIKSHYPEVHINIGGNIFTRLRDSLKNWSEVFGGIFDSVILYEGEIPLLELCRCLSKKQSLAGVPNLVYKENGNIRSNGLCDPEKIDLLPAPCFDGLPLDRYFSPYPVLPVLSSRGCYWKRCAFCDHGEIYSGRYSRRNPELMVKDLGKLSKRHSTNFFTFNDESIAPGHLREISEEIISNGLDVKCNADIRLEPRFTPDLFHLAFKAGFRVLYFGLESGHDRVLAHMCKGIDTQTARAIFQNSSDAGIWNHAFIFFGFPTETETEAHATMDYIFVNKEIIHSVGYSTFLLSRCSGVMKNRERFGVTDVGDDSNAVLDLWASYSVSNGITQEQAQSISKEFSQKLEEEYGDLEVWGTILREHLLLYLANYGARNLSALIKKPSRPSAFLAGKDIHADETRIPVMKSDILWGKARFDVARILNENIREEKPVKSDLVVILWDLETGQTISITPSAAAILARCDGRLNIEGIADELAERHNLPKQRVLADCREIIESMIRSGLCSIKRHQ